MINQDEVFVITEDDILKPGGKGKSAGKGSPLSLAKGSKGAERARGTEETVSERATPAPARRSRSRQPSPATAGTLSLFVWGLGQFYNGDLRLATLFMLCELQVLAFHYFLYRMWDQVLGFVRIWFVSEWELMLYASSIDFCLIFFMIYNVAQAYRGAEAHGGQVSSTKLPVLPGVASALIPGWGQMLNGQLGKATFFLFTFLMQIYIAVLYMRSPFYRIIADLDLKALTMQKAAWGGMLALYLTAMAWAISAYDAYIVARYNRR
jgi:TM2 domain-containing membrane protein YozV